LTELLRDSSPKESCSYRGIAFDINHRGYRWLTTDLGLGLGSVVGGFVGGAVTQTLQPRIGDYVKEWLPNPLGIDLLLRLREEPLSDKDGLNIYFQINAINSYLARRCLKGPLSVVLLAFSETYEFVEMRDDFVEFGPLGPLAEESAADLDALIDALVALYSASYDEDLVEPDLGEGAPFYFYCGFTVHLKTSVCPRWGGRLDGDVDENEDV